MKRSPKKRESTAPMSCGDFEDRITAALLAAVDSGVQRSTAAMSLLRQAFAYVYLSANAEDIEAVLMVAKREGAELARLARKDLLEGKAAGK